MASLDMTIGRRLALGFGSVLALLLVSLGMYLYGNYEQAQATFRLADLIMPKADAANELKSGLLHRPALSHHYRQRLATQHGGVALWGGVAWRPWSFRP